MSHTSLKKQRGSFTWVAALFFMTAIILASFAALNDSQAEDVRVESNNFAEDIKLLMKGLAIHYQLTCEIGEIEVEEIVGVYFKDVRRSLQLDNYYLEINRSGRNAFMTVQVLVNNNDFKYLGKSISEGAVLNGNVLTKRSPFSIYQSARLSLVSDALGTERVAHC